MTKFLIKHIFSRHGKVWGLSIMFLQPIILDVVVKMNCSINRIIEKVTNHYRKGKFKYLDDALWVCRFAFEIPLGISPYRLINGKACHLPIDLQHKIFWDVKKLYFNMHVVGQEKILQVNELEEHKLFSYENDELYKEKIKKIA